MLLKEAFIKERSLPEQGSSLYFVLIMTAALG